MDKFLTNFIETMFFFWTFLFGFFAWFLMGVGMWEFVYHDINLFFPFFSGTLGGLYLAVIVRNRRPREK